MKRNEIIRHYKEFFNLQTTELNEDDNLNIDWAEDLVKNCTIPHVSFSEERAEVCDHRYHSVNGRYMLYEDWCEKCGTYIKQT